MQSTHLPLQLTTLVGREQDVTALCEHLQRPDVRLVTLTGTGGIGKTRLGIQAARNLSASFSSGVHFVSLASLRDPKLVFPTIAQMLGVVSDTSDWPVLEHLKTYLQEHNLLLLLDNFEQVITAAPGLEDILASCPKVKILVTSRAVLHIQGEYEFPVALLSLPDPRHSNQLETLTDYAAIALFLQRAQSSKPDFQLTEANAADIIEICLRLDGLPLAIELAAARIKLLPPHALLKRLRQSLQFLASPRQRITSRQQTLYNTLTWSYELLAEPEQQMFRRLSVFIGGCTLEAAEALCMAYSLTDHDTFLDRIASLIDQSLLYQAEQNSHEPRLFMLETIHTYACEYLSASKEAELIHHTHATYYLELAEEAESKLTGPEQHNWLGRLELEHDNLRAALSWFAKQPEQAMALRLSGALWRFWWMTGQINEGRTFLEQALQASEASEMVAHAKALNALGTLAGLQGDFAHAETLCTKSLQIFRNLDNTQGITTSLWMLGYVASDQSHYELAQQKLTESLNLARASGYLWGVAYSLELLAVIAFHQGNYTHAHVLVDESLALSRQTADTWGIARTLWLKALIVLALRDHQHAERLFKESLECSYQIKDKRGIGNALVMSGYVAFFQQNYRAMHTFLEEGLPLLREVGDRRGIAWGLYGLGWLAVAEKRYEEAYICFEESLTILRDLKHEWFIVLCLEGMGVAVATQQQPCQAASIWGYADARRKKARVARPPIVQSLYEHYVTGAKAQAGEARFLHAWSIGEAMTMEQMLSASTAETKISSPWVQSIAVPLRRSPYGLTTREIEVLRWVAQGFTDHQIAEKLVISPRTVSTHLTSIYTKLGVATRSAATCIALEQHLL